MESIPNHQAIPRCRVRGNLKAQAACLTAWGVLIASLHSCNALQQPDYAELPTVASVDLERYLGRWYEIARYPNDFEQGCIGVTANYSLLSNGQVKVINTCRDSEGNTTEIIQGTARVDDPTTNAKLRVSFFWPFSGPYWIIDLDSDYRYAVVGEPSRTFFWILSRSPTLDDQTIAEIQQKMPGWSYDPERLYFVPQFPEESP